MGNCQIQGCLLPGSDFSQGSGLGLSLQTQFSLSTRHILSAALRCTTTKARRNLATACSAAGANTRGACTQGAPDSFLLVYVYAVVRIRDTKQTTHKTCIGRALGRRLVLWFFPIRFRHEAVTLHIQQRDGGIGTSRIFFLYSFPSTAEDGRFGMDDVTFTG